MRKRREDDSSYDILFTGTDDEWRETLEWLWAQPKLPKKLSSLETLLAYRFGADELSGRLDKDLGIDRAVDRWKMHTVTWVPDKKKPWWRFRA